MLPHVATSAPECLQSRPHLLTAAEWAADDADRESCRREREALRRRSRELGPDACACEESGKTGEYTEHWAQTCVCECTACTAARVRVEEGYAAAAREIERKRERDLAELEEARRVRAAWLASPEGQAEEQARARAEEQNLWAWRAAYEAQERRLDWLCEDLICLNRSDPEGTGSVAEHVEVIRALLAVWAGQCHPPRIFVHKRELVEYDAEYDPPARRVTTYAALRELLERLFCVDGEPLVKFERMQLVGAHPREFLDEAVRQVLAAGRWPGFPQLESWALAQHLAELGAASGEQLALPPGLAGQLIELASGGGFAGSLSELVACQATFARSMIRRSRGSSV